ncbi:putative wall-associated receptor kinase-like 16 [Alnus glutinosa]|uniref:putative wall-associated receptor kinase-like 16 n=1 Tax=Alnus glutinosa TaxID=3517 RepID=UPI002D7753FD|nr:putative wall-associated receptor kinase-like 16 [Alnus glutinosa]
MALHGMLLQQKLLLGALILAATAASQPGWSCNNTCGNLTIPYPFGTSEGCYLDPSFLIACNYSSGTPKPFLSSNTSNVLVLNISLLDGELRVSNFIARDCYNELGFLVNSLDAWFNLRDFTVSYTRNKFIVVGCDTFAYIEGFFYDMFHGSGVQKYKTGLDGYCGRINSVVNGSCSGLGCSQTPIPEGLMNFSITVNSYYNHSAVRSFNPCGFAFLVEAEAYNFSSLDLQQLQNKKTVPLVLDWAVGNQTCENAQKNRSSYACKAEYSYCNNSINGPGYRCNCSKGFQGNPYLPDGCTDIDECKNPESCNNVTQICNNFPGGFNCSCLKGYEDDGSGTTSCRAKVNQSRVTSIALGISISLLALVVTGSWISWALKRRKLLKLKEKFFKQNGGLMLQQQLSSHRGSVETDKIFSAEELKKATNNYDKSRVLGQGGYGTVYKGVLPDNKVVAIKKSKISDQSQIEQFINEVIVLTQINHRNVVKLLGCCLETEVPLLVYEFITNGTLSDHIHNKSLSSSLSWEKRLKIAAETAGALAYLHSSTSMPIIHRDVKTTNILLDVNYMAKVSDFGASKLVPLDQTQLTTLVQGTFGYLDPEYFHTSQLTEKSDVYSFGVVIAELLTGKEALSFNRPESDRNLAKFFISAIKEDRLLQILEDHIVNEGNIEELKEVANLAKRCLRVRGEDRPSMKEVAMELEGLTIMGKHPWGKADLYMEETEYLLNNCNNGPTHSFSIDVGIASSSTDTTIRYDSMMNQELKPVDDGR